MANQTKTDQPLTFEQKRSEAIEKSLINRSAKKAVEAVDKVLKASGLPLVVFGPGQPDPDNELLVEISIPPIPPRTGTCYKQVARQKGAQFQVAVAVMVTLDRRKCCKEANVVLMGVGITPILAKEAAAVLIGKELGDDVIGSAAEIAAEKEADPGEDIHATEEYRRHLVEVLVRQALAEGAKRALKKGR